MATKMDDYRQTYTKHGERDHSIPLRFMDRWLSPRLAEAKREIHSMPLRVEDFPQWMRALKAVERAEDAIAELKRLASWLSLLLASVPFELIGVMLPL